MSKATGRPAAVPALLLVAAALGAALLWRPARLDAAEAGLHRRTVAELARIEHVPPDRLEAMEAAVRHEAGQNCVELREGWPRRPLHARICYDAATGEERNVHIGGGF